MQSIMKMCRFLLIAVGMLACVARAEPTARVTESSEDPIQVLVLTGANNHDWKATTKELKKIYASSDRFAVKVELKPEGLTADMLAQYDVLISNWNNFGKDNNAAPWPASLRTAYVEFVRRGGGHVAVHAGSTAHYDWPDYQTIGLANWDISGGTGHGPVHEFEARVVDAGHPITAGLGAFKTTDELWHKPRVDPNARVLVEAYSSITSEWEPSAFTGRFGEGRCFTTLLGHDAKAMRNPAFQELLRRGTAWAGNRDDSDLSGSAGEKRMENPFFAFDNGVGIGEWTPQQQAETLKELGYDGIGYIGVHGFSERQAAFVEAGLPIYNLYVQCDPTATPAYHPMILDTLPKMEGTGAALWLPVFGKTTDDDAARVVQEIADAAAPYGVRVVLYPHAHFHIATTSDAVRLLKVVDRMNVGVSINVCHEIYAGNGDKLGEIVKEAAPFLEFVSINGADRKARTWDKLIQTLDEGDFDQASFLKQLYQAGYTGPIGLQCHGLKGDKRENLAKSLSAWKKVSGP